MPDPRAPRLAVLIDADNVPSSHAEAIFEEIASLGEASVRRIYGDWSAQRRAKLMEKYAEQQGKLTKTGEAVRAAFFACTKKGTGLVRVYADQDKQLRVEPVMVDNIIVDDRECSNGSPPRQLHYRQADFDCDALCQQFPDKKVISVARTCLFSESL